MAAIDLDRLITNTAEAAGFEIVRIKMIAGKTLQVMAERPDGTMNVDDCAALSRALSAMLEEKDPIPHEYVLEVSSPGIDRPLARAKDYANALGHEARFEFALPVLGRKRFRGEILEVGPRGVRVQPQLEPAPEPIEIEFTAIAGAKLVLTDRLIEAVAAKRESRPPRDDKKSAKAPRQAAARRK